VVSHVISTEEVKILCTCYCVGVCTSFTSGVWGWVSYVGVLWFLMCGGWGFGLVCNLGRRITVGKYGWMIWCVCAIRLLGVV
jgi:hypothetical protein